LLYFLIEVSAVVLAIVSISFGTVIEAVKKDSESGKSADNIEIKLIKKNRIM
jgi:hypothetical protein